MGRALPSSPLQGSTHCLPETAPVSEVGLRTKGLVLANLHLFEEASLGHGAVAEGCSFKCLMSGGARRAAAKQATLREDVSLDLGSVFGFCLVSDFGEVVACPFLVEMVAVSRVLRLSGSACFVARLVGSRSIGPKARPFKIECCEGSWSWTPMADVLKSLCRSLCEPVRAVSANE